MCKGLSCLVLGVLLSISAPAQTYFDAAIVEADGSVVPIEGLLEIDIDDVTWDYKTLESPKEETRVDLSASASQGYRLYGPGRAHWGNATFTTAAGGSKELQAWFQEAAKGKNIRKDIQVTLKKSNKSAGRSYTLFDCFPVAFDTSSSVQTETLKVNIGRIEFVTRVIQPAAGGGRGKVGVAFDGSREFYDARRNGEPLLHLNAITEISKQATNSPGHKSIAEITLRGAMTDGRQNLCKWLNDASNGNPWKVLIVLTDGAANSARSFNYHECFPVRYVFPRMSVTNTTGNTMEEVSVKPIRLELK